MLKSKRARIKKGVIDKEVHNMNLFESSPKNAHSGQKENDSSNLRSMNVGKASDENCFMAQRLQVNSLFASTNVTERPLRD